LTAIGEDRQAALAMNAFQALRHRDAHELVMPISRVE
jgi:hypothetical protein